MEVAGYSADDVQIDIHVADRKVLLMGEVFYETITIHNETDKPLPPTLLISTSPVGVMKQRGVKVPFVPPYKQVTVSLDVHVSPAASIDDKDPVIIYSYHGVSVISPVPMSFFTRRLSKYQPYHFAAPRFNVVLFGIAGASKSSFVNSALTLLSSDCNALIHRAGVGGSEHHNTHKLAKFDLEGTHMTLWDTWGLTPTTYTSGDLQLLLQGALPNGWDMHDDIGDRPQPGCQQSVHESHQSIRDSRAPHAVLFFIPHGALDKQDETDLIKTAFHQVERMCLLLLLLLFYMVSDDQSPPCLKT
eukprot:TRINITY_DN10641_c0_g1_i3.p1 TRINITY_DN10641_c0_g1~~TRINITY_DN10641_c0_g1_i3.p1  ORF type:complete len:302 (-),score=34.21 TRINITY_DN10641_c0_g1_i3:391-1296(-)